MSRVILVAGATGLIGSLAVDRLLNEGHAVIALTRTMPRQRHPRLRALVRPPERWPEAEPAADVALCALGTTMRAAGSEAAFRTVDFDLVMTFARLAKQRGVRHMIVVSSVGADAESRNFYLALKGEMEAAMAALGFARLDILRPGLLVGPRGGERRAAERIGIALSPLTNLLMRGRFDRFAAIRASTIAGAIAALVDRPEPGVHRHDNRSIRALATA